MAVATVAPVVEFAMLLVIFGYELCGCIGCVGGGYNCDGTGNGYCCSDMISVYRSTAEAVITSSIMLVVAVMVVAVLWRPRLQWNY